KASTTSWLYAYEKGKRLQLSPSTLRDTGPTYAALTTRTPQVVNTRDIPDGGVVAGTDVSLSMAVIPIVSGDRALGTIQLENYEREDAFGEAEIRLLTTVAHAM